MTREKAMTREEAIKWMEETIQDAEGLLDKCSPALKEEVLEQNEVFKIALSALRSVSREQVEKAWKGCSWCNNEGKNPENWECSLLDDRGFSVVVGDEVVWTNADFCPVCGKPLTDEAVEMVMERMDELQNEIG